MSTARKYAANQRSMSPQSRRSAYAAINIIWQQMRPDLHFEDKETIRAERLAWITSFLQLRYPILSTVELSDKQLGLVLEEMRRMTGTKPKSSGDGIVNDITRPQSDGNVINIGDYRKPSAQNTTGAEIEHLAGEAQIYTIKKIVGSIGWKDETFAVFLLKKFRVHSLQMLTFKKATALTMILLNIAADKELRAQGKTKISRKMTAKYIPVLKQKLEIDQ